MKSQKLPAQDLKLILRPGEKLSMHFDNRVDCYKVVEDEVLGYVVQAMSGGGTAVICPLYKAAIHMHVGTVWHMISSYEQGGRLNDYTIQADSQGCALASIAAKAIAALEDRRDCSALCETKRSKKRRSSGVGRT